MTVKHEPAETAFARGWAVTADGLFRMPDDGYRYALVRGELQRMTPAGFDHGAVIMNLAFQGNDWRAGGESRARDKEKR